MGSNLMIATFVLLGATVVPLVSPQKNYSSSSTKRPALFPCSDFYEYVCQNQTRPRDHFADYYTNLGNAFREARDHLDEKPKFIRLLVRLYGKCTEMSNETDLITRKNCLKQLEYDHVEVVLRIYVDHFVHAYLGGNRSQLNATRAKASLMATLVKEAFRTRLTGPQSWLDAYSQSRVSEKLQLMRQLIGYPDHIFNDTLMDMMYGIEDQGNNNNFTQQSNCTESETTFVSLLNEISNFRIGRRILKKAKEDGYKRLTSYLNFAQRQEIYDFKEWRDVKFFIGSHYDSTRNFLHIPLFELHSPYFALNYPATVNFALKGRSVGHEIGHGFHDSWANISGKEDWREALVWSEATRTEYNIRTACLQEQYNNVPLDPIQPSVMPRVDGVFTARENIADHAGMVSAFYAMQTYLRNHSVEEPLAYKPEMLNWYTPEQLYFVNSAQRWCIARHKRYRPLYIDDLIRDRHAAPWHRVNEPLKNFDEFAKAFNCPPNSTMNPTEKCTMW